MKKMFVCLLAVVTLFACTLTVTAEDTDFVSSITNKGAPEVVYEEKDGEKVIGQVLGADGSVISVECLDHIIITSVSDAATSTEIPADAKETLLRVYEELSKAGVKLSEVFPELNDAVAKALGAGKDADDLVIRDLFDISGTCEDLKALPKEGRTVRLTFDLSLPVSSSLSAKGPKQAAESDFVAGMVYVDGAWKQLDMTNNGDGTVSVVFDQLCPVAFLVPAAEEGPTAPTTGEDHTNLIFWGVMLTVSLTALVVLVVFSRKKAKE